MFPTWDQYRADQYAPVPQYYGTAAGGGYVLQAPALGQNLNLVAAHLDLIDFAERALGTRDVLMTESQVWAKYSGNEDFEQGLHVDSMTTSILDPPSVESPEQVTITVYYVDIDSDLGPTCIVPRDLTQDEHLVPYIRPRRHYPEFYAKERPILVPAGSVLLYDLRTFHRGSAITRPRGVRLSHHIVYRRASARWGRVKCWSDYGFYEEFQRLLEKATPRQRELFGVPAPGHPYWNAETVAGVASRYLNMDMRPYADAAGVPHSVIDAARERMKSVPPPNDLTYPNGVVRATGYIRQWIRAMEYYQPTTAAYYQAVLDFYEAASAGKTQFGR